MPSPQLRKNVTVNLLLFLSSTPPRQGCSYPRGRAGPERNPGGKGRSHHEGNGPAMSGDPSETVRSGRVLLASTLCRTMPSLRMRSWISDIASCFIAAAAPLPPSSPLPASPGPTSSGQGGRRGQRGPLPLLTPQPVRAG